MLKRTITGIILVAVLLPFLIFPVLEIGFEILFLLGALVGTWELLRLYGHEEKFNIGEKIVIYISTALAYLAILALNITPGHHSLLLPMRPITGVASLLIAAVLELSLLVFSPKCDAKHVSKAIFISFYLGFGCGSIATLRVMGTRYIVYLFLITMLTDVFAYVYGCLFGRHKMAPNISPKKSWEGAIAGSIVAIVTATIFAYNYGMFFSGTKATIFDGLGRFTEFSEPLKIVIIVFVTTIGSICGQIGDLIASKLKRSYDVKDYSNIFPGHGGFLDRFDSATFTAMIIASLFILISCL